MLATPIMLAIPPNSPVMISRHIIPFGILLFFLSLLLSVVCCWGNSSCVETVFLLISVLFTLFVIKVRNRVYLLFSLLKDICKRHHFMRVSRGVFRYCFHIMVLYLRLHLYFAGKFKIFISIYLISDFIFLFSIDIFCAIMIFQLFYQYMPNIFYESCCQCSQGLQKEHCNLLFIASFLLLSGLSCY